jgi:hypothetical protein
MWDRGLLYARCRSRRVLDNLFKDRNILESLYAKMGKNKNKHWDYKGEPWQCGGGHIVCFTLWSFIGDVSLARVVQNLYSLSHLEWLLLVL